MPPQSQRILLVEDNPGDARLIVEYVQEDSARQFELVQVERLATGLEVLAQGDIDLVLLDLNLPDSQGFDTFTKLQAAAPETAIVVLTGLSDEGMAVQAVREGAQDYLIKGALDGSLLLRAIRYAIERQRLIESVREGTRELQAMENRYRTLFNAAADAIFFTDLEGRLLEVNEEGCRLLGYTREQLRHLNVGDVASPEYVARLPELLKQLQATGHIVFETDFITRDRRVIPIECSSRLMSLQGQPAMLSIARDISERKRAVESLHASEERYRALMANTIHAVMLHEVLYDSEGRPNDYRFLMVNPAFERLTGLSSEQVIGRTVKQVLPGRDLFWIENYEQVVSTGAPVTFERYEESLQRHFWVAAYKIQDNQFAMLFSDITAAKQAEANRIVAITESLQSLAMAIEMRDPYTSGHQRRVTALAGAISRELGLDEERIRGIELGAILHDIGKISVPAETLSKPGKISPIEFGLIKRHPESGYEILKNIVSPWPLSKMVLQHHERLNGSGYPHGVKNDEIILEAKILAVADVVEAISSHRPYRPALGLDRALEEIIRGKGNLYDPEVVDACAKLFTEKRFVFE
jgi:PAS domain S-box-containing protein/putative nucleotidyltransferase with HDIG domain